MNRNILIAGLTQLTILLLALLLGCPGKDSGSQDSGAQGQGAATASSGRDAGADEKIKVVCTIGMITDIAQIVGGERAEVTGLMGAGVDPHLYQAKASDLKLLQEAELIFYNGLHLEAKLGDLLVKLASDVKTVQVTSAIPESELLSPPEFAGFHDPHVWMDAALWKTIIAVIRDTYSDMDPGHAGEYSANAAALELEFDTLDAYVKERCGEIPEAQRVLVTAHDAFGYFGRAYGFEVRGLQGISTQAEAGTADVQELVDFVVERRIPAIFVESSVPRRNVEAVQAAARAKGWKVSIGGELFSDAMGDAGTPEGTYLGMIRANTDTIVEALSPSAAGGQP